VSEDRIVLRSLYQRILGNPFVYHNVRPLAVGGIDYTQQYAALEVSPGDVVLDIGCGGGDALRYLRAFSRYEGYDSDPVAIGFAVDRPEAQRPDVRFEAALVDRDVLARVAPTRIMMNGLLHHLDDGDAAGLLAMCAETPSLERLVTNDVTFLDGKPVNNLLSRLDRGKFVRSAEAYRSLASRSGFDVARLELVRSHPTFGLAYYVVMVLEPKRHRP
jgi:SAM-dependent methyltransferase